MSEFDRDIFLAIKGYSPHNPQDLVGILAAVDARQRLILSHEELIGGIDRLIARGQVAEAANCRYYVPTSPPTIRSFSGIARAEYDRACVAYSDASSETLRELSAIPPSPRDKTRQKIVVRWKLPRQDFPSDSDEDAIEPLMEMIGHVLDADGRAEIVGCENGPGAIDVLIFGEETDADTDDIYSMVRPVFVEFGCPPGSCIIRQFSDQQREVISDVVRRTSEI
jgi:predicted NUDIX family NTP pyrophosphohydrolase